MFSVQCSGRGEWGKMPRVYENMNYAKNMGEIHGVWVSTYILNISLRESTLFVDDISMNFS